MGTLIRRPVVLVIDEAPAQLRLMSAILKNNYCVKTASSNTQALKLIDENLPDLILLDSMMLKMGDPAITRYLKANLQVRNVPLILLMPKTETVSEDSRYGLSLGAADYITKPVSPPIVLARVQHYLWQKTLADLLRNQNIYLQAEITRRTQQVQAAQDAAMLALASLAGTRDSETGKHVKRTQRYVRALAKHLQSHPKYAKELCEENIDLLFKSAPLHDIGKVGIPDHILLKPGKLTTDEFEIMKTHTVLGRDAISDTEAELGIPLGFLRYAKEIAYSHQEKWDGSGYPQGLSGEDIPLSARLMALADTYDALISKRIYKPGMSHAEALQVICDGSGSHFDPEMVQAFLEINEQFFEISTIWADT
ncbi:putative two-component system response regulator [Pseudomonas sp. LAMO17WK12:I10]|uniref:response regulator n=1 Tax=unclassified Pseudomonas TaxID=196821 RepID=UPI000BD2D530|nr:MULTISPECIES: HD domain-containing phosphohydrolase [unclassified Pseudomonas]PXX50347.1 putative two-component system response regulator [Pseudomonas sp. LAMO17WK12:I9]SNY54179.1 putative two-component system response regulator [Pseudomonas sp. LAMO17WK12:I10]